MEPARRPLPSEPFVAILEDDEGLRRAIARLLTIAGYRTSTFSSTTDDGIVACMAHARCLVADVHLPGVSGPAFYASIPWPRPPVVFITAQDTSSVRDTIRAIGANELLAKPFLGSDLLAAVERATRHVT
ncbi:response regulator [Pandoraea anhela]|uniref:C4-dicarboxylate transport transcriptional regulatory protein DctD n=1 Tax=Pandoraea anhela TaxID=2508295 RepID=A0A5E4WS63_9BURK|nr:response regulator [Pandoraea anhela]VVE27602.1 C4-dicarboxylate transport transcriptional regulatory protein DctD [Pandoraea anhela]